MVGVRNPHVTPYLPHPLTMCRASGWWEKKSAMRHPSWMWDLGLGLRAWTMSGNFMPSRMKNTGMLLPTCVFVEGGGAGATYGQDKA